MDLYTCCLIGIDDRGLKYGSGYVVAQTQRDAESAALSLARKTFPHHKRHEAVANRAERQHIMTLVESWGYKLGVR